MVEVLVGNIEAFLARHPNVLSAWRVLLYAVVTAVLIELGLGDIASAAVSAVPAP